MEGKQQIWVQRVLATALVRLTGRAAPKRPGRFPEGDPGEAMLWIDRTGRILAGNEAALTAYGYWPTELTRLKLKELQARVEAGGETLHRRKDGSTFFAEVSILQAHDEGQGVQLVVVRDVSARKQAEGTDALLNETDLHLAQGRPFGEVLTAACEQLVRLFGFSLAWIAVTEPDGRLRDAGIAGADGVGALTEEKALTIEAHLRLPLIAGGESLGTLAVAHARPMPVHPQASDLLRHFATHLARSLKAVWCQPHSATAPSEEAGPHPNAVILAGPDGRIVWANAACACLTGFSDAELLGHPLDLCMPDGDTVRALWAQVRRGESFSAELTQRRKDGSSYPEQLTVSPVLDTAGTLTYLVMVKADLTGRREREEHLRHLALHDPLTGLPNRRVLQERFERLIAAYRPAALLLMDLDHFKLVNDTFGHPAGDRVLCAVARALTQALRPGDLLVRLGGDEFAVILEGVGADTAMEVARRLRASVAEVRVPEGAYAVRTSLSVGVLPMAEPLPFEEAAERADQALYAAKEKGHNRAQVYRARGHVVRLPQAGAGAARRRVRPVRYGRTGMVVRMRSETESGGRGG